MRFVAHKSRTLLMLLLILVVSCALIACGGGKESSTGTSQQDAEVGTDSEPQGEQYNLDLKTAAEVMDYVRDMAPETRKKVLLQGAIKHGPITLYTTLNEQEQQEFSNALKRAHPEITLDVWRGNSDEVFAKVVQEFRSNNNIVDVIDNKVGYVYHLKKEGIIIPHTPPNIDVFPESMYDPEGYWMAQNVIPYDLTWNTNNLSEADTPNTWEDLTDPRYSGRFSMDTQDELVLYYWRSVFGEEKGNELAQKIADNNPRLIKGRTAQMALLSAGEFDMAVSMFEHNTFEAMRQGAPVDFKYLEGPVLIDRQTTTLPKHARNPYGAVFLKDWMSSVEGQQYIVDSGRVAAMPNMTYPDERQGAVLKERELFGINIDEYGPIHEQLLADFKRIFGLTQ